MNNEVELQIAITEIEEFLPDRIDGVAVPANGAPFLMVKSVNGVAVEPRRGPSHYEALASATTDQTLAKGYRKLAKKARKAK
jgi:hypothetical protein